MDSLLKEIDLSKKVIEIWINIQTTIVSGPRQVGAVGNTSLPLIWYWAQLPGRHEVETFVVS